MTFIGIWLGSSWSTETSIDIVVCFPLLMKKTSGNVVVGMVEGWGSEDGVVGVRRLRRRMARR